MGGAGAVVWKYIPFGLKVSIYAGEQEHRQTLGTRKLWKLENLKILKIILGTCWTTFVFILYAVDVKVSIYAGDQEHRQTLGTRNFVTEAFKFTEWNNLLYSIIKLIF